MKLIENLLSKLDGMNGLELLIFCVTFIICGYAIFKLVDGIRKERDKWNTGN